MGTNEKRADPVPAAREGVLCAKCEHLNPASNETCSRCGAHLYLTCPKCGHANRRVSSRCTHCGMRLHRSFWQHWRRRFASGRFKITPLQIGLAIVVALVVYKIIVMLAEYSPAPPE